MWENIINAAAALSAIIAIIMSWRMFKISRSSDASDAIVKKLNEHSTDIALLKQGLKQNENALNCGLARIEKSQDTTLTILLDILKKEQNNEKT